MAAKSSQVMLGYCCVWKIKSLSLNQSDKFQAGARTVSVDQLPVSQGWTCLGQGGAGTGCCCHAPSKPRARYKLLQCTQQGATWFTDLVSLDSSTKLPSMHVLCPLTTGSKEKLIKSCIHFLGAVCHALKEIWSLMSRKK